MKFQYYGDDDVPLTNMQSHGCRLITICSHFNNQHTFFFLVNFDAYHKSKSTSDQFNVYNEYVLLTQKKR